MSFATLSFAFVCQFLEAEPEMARPGDEVVVSVLDAARAPLAGVPVAVRHPDGEVVRLGVADAAGQARFSVTVAGDYEFHATLGTPAAPLRLIRPYSVLPPSRRWVYVLLCLPAGVLLLWWNLRNALAGGGAATPGDGDA